MGLFYCCCCTLLVLVNIVYMLIGLALLIVGILFMVAKDLIKNFLQNFLPEVLSNLNNKANLGITDEQIINYVISALSSITIALIIIGAIFLIISIIGMTSVCCKSKVLIIVFITILSAIVLVQIIVVIIYAADPTKLEDAVTSILKPMIAKYEGFMSTNGESFIINIINIALNCCGANGYTDFETATKFNRTFSQEFSYNGNKFKYNTNLTYPISCCKFNNFNFENMNECINDKTSNNKDDGCVKKLLSTIKTSSDLAFKVIGGIIGYQVSIILAATICLVSVIKEAGVKPV